MPFFQHKRKKEQHIHEIKFRKRNQYLFTANKKKIGSNETKKHSDNQISQHLYKTIIPFLNIQ